MNERIRDILLAHVRKNIRDEGLANQLEILCHNITGRLYAPLLAKYPQDEMAVLAKYDLTRPISSVVVCFPDNGNYLPTEVAVKLVYTSPLSSPDMAEILCPTNVFQPVIELDSDDLFDQCRIMQGLESDFREQTAKLHRAYKSIIREAVSLKEIINVWPEAATIIAESDAARDSRFAEAMTIIRNAQSSTKDKESRE